MRLDGATTSRLYDLCTKVVIALTRPFMEHNTGLRSESLVLVATGTKSRRVRVRVGSCRWSDNASRSRARGDTQCTSQQSVDVI